MAKRFGNDVMLWVETSTPGTYVPLKGQKNLKRSGGSKKMDTSDKTTGGYDTAAFGNKSWGLTVDVSPDLPDANGYTRLETLCLASPAVPFNIQIQKGGLRNALSDIIFAASVYGDLTSQDFDKDDVVGASFAFVLAGAPTIDQLG